jgi:hypothetical protein
VWLSEELRDKTAVLAQAAGNAESGGAAAQSGSGNPEAVDWTGAIRYAALGAVIAAALTLLSMAAPPVLLLTWLWILASPVVVIGVYHSRHPQTVMTGGLGARMGLLTGLFVILVMGSINTAALAIGRHMHAMGDFDGRLSTMIQQATQQAQATAGGAENPFLRQMALPEFRVGMMLAGVAMGVVMLLALSMLLGAAFSALALARPARRA